MEVETPAIPSELLLLVYIHGFRGGTDTFASFPDRVRHSLAASHPSIGVESIVYPPYDTRGDLVTAVDNHVVWLTTQAATRAADYKEKGGKGPIRVVLLGHSMGGLVIADTLLALLKTSSPWPSILGIIAYDSPLSGLNNTIFKSTMEKYAGYASAATTALSGLGVGVGFLGNLLSQRKTEAGSSHASASASSSDEDKRKDKGKGKGKASPAPASSTAVTTTSSSSTTTTPSTSSSWLSLPVVAGIGAAAAVSVAAGAAYWQRDTISQSWDWATSHLSFIRELWKAEALEERLEGLAEACDSGVGFHCFYTRLGGPASKDRTFIVLPSTRIRHLFTANVNTLASDEIEAHVDMFEEKSDGMYALASGTCQVLSGWLAKKQREEGMVGMNGAVDDGEEKQRGKMARSKRMV